MSIHPSSTAADSVAEHLNRACRCGTLDRTLLRAELGESDELYRMLVEERPYLFANSPVFIPAASLHRQADIIDAIEQVIALPTYRARVLAHAPETAHFRPKAVGVFLGYDFHLGTSGPKLIEINTNAGGPLLNALLPRVHRTCCEIAEASSAAHPVEPRFIEMFREEWGLERGTAHLDCIAIVDDQPRAQFLYPEFLMFQALFRRNGIDAVICDPEELAMRDGSLWHQNRKIGLVYNRLTDFSLEQDTHRTLREAYLTGAAVVTPHPHAHALYADKRNLALLTDDAALQDLGVDARTRDVLLEGIAHTEVIRDDQNDRLWGERKRYFFKPAAGYGSKAAYRGDKLTRRVFQDILAGDYVAQELVMPSERCLEWEGEQIRLKVDLRNFVYQKNVQAVASRMYQGQTTNLRTPGGGFAPVVVIP